MVLSGTHFITQKQDKGGPDDIEKMESIFKFETESEIIYERYVMILHKQSTFRGIIHIIACASILPIVHTKLDL